MIETFLYSIAGKKTNVSIDALLQNFVSSPYLPSADKRILKHTIEVSENGNYPSEEYYSSFYEYPSVTYKSIAEIKTHCDKALDFYQRQYIQQSVIKAINEAESAKDLISTIQESINIPIVEADAEEYKPKLYSKLRDSLTKGLNTGVKELDEVTCGAQPGSVMAFCGFVAHGKSTMLNSVIFNNVLEGKKGLLITLELPPDILWPEFEARYMNQVKNIQVTGQDLIFNRVPKDIEEQIEANEQDFVNEFCNNLKIVDEGFIDKSLMLNYKALSNKVRSIEEQLGGLDFIAFDHVTQLELMFPDYGNSMIKTIQSLTKTYKDKRGIRPVTFIVVQANREGEKRARKRNGVYDLQAISDLNEVERTSSYCVFLYTSDDMKIMQETKITMMKHRFGAPIVEPIVTTFNPAVITVGQSVESVEVSENDFNALDLDLGDSFDDFG